MATDRRNTAAWLLVLLRPLLPVAFAFLLFGCATRGPVDAGENATAADDPPRPVNVVEPIGQRSPYGNFSPDGLPSANATTDAPPWR